MCGIIAVLLARDEEAGAIPQDNCNQLIYDGLTVLQHRGQGVHARGSGRFGSTSVILQPFRVVARLADAAGIVTTDERGRFHLRKANGMVSDVFKNHHMQELVGNMGIGHCRYPTAGNSSSAEAQPFYTNTPHGLCLAHNGNLTNCDEARQYLTERMRHMNTSSDSELLLNVLALELAESLTPKTPIKPEDIFGAITRLHTRVKGGYAVVAAISTGGLVAFRDPHGIRPLAFGTRASGTSSDYVVASESVAIDTLGFELVRDVKPGEGVYIDCTGRLHAMPCHASPTLSPCIFEHVYMARPDSVIDGVSVYASRLLMGEKLANKIKRVLAGRPMDVVMPVPDTSRPCALEAARILGLPYREGFIKNRYIARTFIMPGQAMRKKNIRRKLNTIKSEFEGRHVILVDDSIVRGTTSTQIIEMARDAGALSVVFASASPMIVYPNVYGIDMPIASELIAHGRDEAGVAEAIGADAVVYNEIEDLEEAVREVSPQVTRV
jgi:amidophosphoribosyltransferase|eukprot:SAG25_NODE_476_length_7542_cov_3.148193_2_plen_495_part_00